MKRKIFTTLLLCYFVLPPSFAQEIIGAAGKVSQDADATAQLSWTIGEVVIPTLSDTDNTLTQGFHQTLFNFLSLVPEEKNTVSIYPNPAQNSLNITSSTSENSEVIIYNSLGQIVIQQKYSNTIDISALASGFYYLKIYDNQTITLKFEKL